MYVNVVSLKVTLKLQSGGDHVGEHEKKDRKIPEETICILTFVQETGRKVNKTDRNSPSKDQFQSGRTSLDQGNLDQRKNVEMNRFQNSPEDRREIKRVQHSSDFFPHNPALTLCFSLDKFFSSTHSMHCFLVGVALHLHPSPLSVVSHWSHARTTGTQIYPGQALFILNSGPPHPNPKPARNLLLKVSIIVQIQHAENLCSSSQKRFFPFDQAIRLPIYLVVQERSPSDIINTFFPYPSVSYPPPRSINIKSNTSLSASFPFLH